MKIGRSIKFRMVLNYILEPNVFVGLPFFSVSGAWVWQGWGGDGTVLQGQKASKGSAAADSIFDLSQSYSELRNSAFKGRKVKTVSAGR